MSTWWIALVALTALLLGCSSHHRQDAIAAKPSVSQSAPAPPLFDGTQAYRLVEQQLAFGPRVPGTPGHDECRRFLRQLLSTYADTVFEQRFTREVYGKRLALTNIGASFRPELPIRVLFCAHWDTRPYADEDADPQKRDLPILGANDGASGTAILVELARCLSHTPPPIGVDILLVDGEDYGKSSDLENFCLGSRYAAQHYPFPKPPQWVIVVDLVGDREAWFPWEEYSWHSAPELLQELWAIGSRRSFEMFRYTRYLPIFDDHVPFINAGMRAVLIIDAELVGNQSPNPRRRYWHTHHDQIDNISAASLQIVGQTLLDWLYQRAW